VTCYVRISEEGGVATVAAQDLMNGADVCVTLGTEIKWFTSEPASKFSVKFAENPFSNSPSASFNGNVGNAPKGGKASHLPPNTPDACYQYSVTHNAAVLDPKVIVKGGSLLTDAAAKPKPMDNK
jgi:hypothetical protein